MGVNTWSKAEDDTLRKYVETQTTWDDIGHVIPSRSKKASIARAHRIGLSIIPKWTQQERMKLKKHYANLDWKVLYPMFPGRSKRSIMEQAHTMGLARKHQTGLFSRDEDVRLKTLHNTKRSWRAIERMFPGKTKEQIYRRMYALGVKKIPDRHTSWTEGEEQLLFDTVDLSYSWDEVYPVFPNRSRESIRSKAQSMDLRITRENVMPEKKRVKKRGVTPPKDPSTYTHDVFQKYDLF